MRALLLVFALVAVTASGCAWGDKNLLPSDDPTTVEIETNSKAERDVEGISSLLNLLGLGGIATILTGGTMSAAAAYQALRKKPKPGDA